MRIILASVVPALIYLAVIRMTERYGREKWRTVLGAFLWGLISALIAAFLELFIGMFVSLNFTTSAVLLAPVIEEITKPLIFFGSREREVEDGIIKGASAGIGFACLENILYFSGTESSLLPFIIVIRTIDGFMMHSAAAVYRTWHSKRKCSAIPFNSHGHALSEQFPCYFRVSWHICFCGVVCASFCLYKISHKKIR